MELGKLIRKLIGNDIKKEPPKEKGEITRQLDIAHQLREQGRITEALKVYSDFIAVHDKNAQVYGRPTEVIKVSERSAAEQAKDYINEDFIKVVESDSVFYLYMGLNGSDSIPPSTRSDNPYYLRRGKLTSPVAYESLDDRTKMAFHSQKEIVREIAQLAHINACGEENILAEAAYYFSLFHEGDRDLISMLYRLSGVSNLKNLENPMTVIKFCHFIGVSDDFTRKTYATTKYRLETESKERALAFAMKFLDKRYLEMNGYPGVPKEFCRDTLEGYEEARAELKNKKTLTFKEREKLVELETLFSLGIYNAFNHNR